MYVNKSYLIISLMIGSLFVGVESFTMLQPPHTNNLLLEDYSIDYMNNSVTINVRSVINTKLQLLAYVNNKSYLFFSNNTDFHTIQLSFPNTHFSLTGILKTETGSQETFMANKSIYQPPSLYLHTYSRLMKKNDTEILFRSNIELNTRLSNILLLNSSFNTFYYKYSEVIMQNKSITLIDTFLRSFNTIIYAINPSSVKPPNGGPIDPTPIIIINGTLSANNSIDLSNKTINNEQFIINSTLISNTTLTNSLLKSNYTQAKQSVISLSVVQSNISSTFDYSTISNSTIQSNGEMFFKSVKIYNSQLIGHFVSISDSVLFNSTIQSVEHTYTNVSFLNYTLSNQKNISFGYTSNYQIANNSAIIFYIGTNLTANISINLMSLGGNYSTTLSSILGNISYVFSNLMPTNYTTIITFHYDNKSYIQSYLIELQNNTPPKLLNYTLLVGYTNLSASFQFSKMVTGSIVLHSISNQTTKSFSINTTQIKNILVYGLAPFDSYFFTTSVKDMIGDFLEQNSSTFSLQTINSINFYVNSSKSTISKYDTNLTITPTLFINNVVINNRNYTLTLNCTYSNDITENFLYPYGQELLRLDNNLLQQLPNGYITITAYLSVFNISTLKNITLYTQTSLIYIVTPILVQNSTINSLMVSVNTNINTTIISKITSSTSSDTINNNTLAFYHSFSFSNLIFTSYNLTVKITSWDNQTAYYYYYFKDNDTIPPSITNYQIDPGYTNFTFSITLSKLSIVNIQVFLVDTGAVVYSYTNYFYDMNFVFVATNLNPYSTYGIKIIADDSNGNQLNYTISNIHMKNITSKFISVTTNKSVVQTNDNQIYVTALLVIDGSIYHDNLLIQTNVTMNVNNASDGGFYILFDPILLKSLNKGTSIKITINNSLFNVTTNFIILYVATDGSNILNSYQILTNSSFITPGPLQLTLSASLNDSTTFDSVTYAEVKLQELGLSLGYYNLVSSGHSFNQSIIVNLTNISINGQSNTIIVILYGNSLFKTVNKSIKLQFSSTGASNPQLISNIVTLIGTSSNLTITTNEPVSITLAYGKTIGSFSTVSFPARYINTASFNLSTFMALNSYNYYYIILSDSLGYESIYDNNSSYFTVFISYLITPSNTSTIIVTSNYYIQFTTNEPVMVTVTCVDYFNNIITCYNSSTYQTSINGLLSLGLSGMYYTISKVTLTDQFGNSKSINPNIVFYY